MGYPGSIAYGFMPELIASIALTSPELKVELVEPTDISIEPLLLNYQMDLAFRRDPAEHPSLQSICLYAEHFSLIVPASHPVKEENFKGLQEVQAEKFILSGLHHQTFYVSSLRQMFEDFGFTPNVYIESDFGGIILGMVAKGLGVFILPSSFSFRAPPNVRFISLPYPVSLNVTWRKDDKSPVLRNVLQQVQGTALTFDAVKIYCSSSSIHLSIH